MGIVAGIIGLAIGVISSLVSGIMTVSQSMADAQYAEQMAQYNAEMARRKAEYQARQQEVQAQIEQQQGVQIQEEAIEREKTTRENYQRLMAQQEALYAGAGYMIEGTPLAVLGETAKTEEKEALGVRREGEKGWQHHEYKQRQLLNEADFSRVMGEHNAQMALYQGEIAKANAQWKMLGGFGTAFIGGATAVGQFASNQQNMDTMEGWFSSSKGSGGTGWNQKTVGGSGVYQANNGAYGYAPQSSYTRATNPTPLFGNSSDTITSLF